MATVAAHALNPRILAQKPSDPVADFAPVSLLVLVPNVLAVHPEALAAAARTTRADPAVVEGMAEFSATVVASSPAELADHMKAEMAKREPVVRDANVSMD